MRMDSSKYRNLMLARMAFVLAGLALAIASPDGLNGVNKQPNFIGVIELAEKIKNREEFLLVDLRDSIAFEAFHIPKAKNIPFDDFDYGSLNESVVIYSGDDLHTRRIWDSLPTALRGKTSILYGGIRDWYDYLQYPTLPFGKYVSDKQLFKRVHDLCEYYGGYADFAADSTILEYYKVDLTSVKWPKVKVGGKLVRKGC